MPRTGDPSLPPNAPDAARSAGGQPGRGRTAPEVPPPRSADAAEEWARFVECWQDRFYSLARRVLGEGSRAQDATQEIFLTIWRKRGRYEPRKPLRAWLYRLAMNTLLAEMRKERRRHRREREAAVPDRTTDPDSSVEADETRRIIEGHLAGLPPRSRALLLMHYQHGLSQREIARTLRTSRTTVQDRLAKALDQMRGALRRNGHLGLIPLVEVTLGSTRLDAAPPLLTQSLVAVPQTALAGSAAGATAGVLTWGGITMSKATLVIVAVAAISLTIGLGAGRSFGPGDSGGRPDPSADSDLASRLADAEKTLADLREENEALTAELTRANEARASLTEELAAMVSALESARTDLQERGSGEVIGADGIDWAAFESTIRDNADLLLRIGELFGQGLDPGEHLSREELAQFMALQRMWESAATIARRDSIHPFLESDVLSPLVAAIFSGPLDLDARQRAELVHATGLLLGEWPGAAEGTPLEAWRARNAILAGLGDTLDGLLGPDQAGAWENLRPLTDRMLEGSLRDSSIGLEGAEGVPERIRDDWSGHYGILPEQQAAFEQVLSEYDRAVRAAMAQYLSEGEQLDGLSAADAAALQQLYLQEQLLAEQAILGFLEPEQIEAMRSRRPAIYSFEPTGRTRISESDSGGF